MSAWTSACNCALSPSTAARAVSKSDMAERAASSSSARRAAFGRALVRASALDMTCTVMAAARCAKRSVLIASSRFSFSHRTVTTMAHLQLPPSESCKMRVSLESR
eukprot:scaffold209469_cov26-Tisochrysis_lutea.AAC.3